MEIRRLRWDPWNIGHIARHRVVPEEVEEVCQNEHLALGVKYGRLMLIGMTDGGRVLAVILEEETEHEYYVVTARPADRKERRLLTAHLEDEDE